MSKPQSLSQQASHGAMWSLLSNITVSAVSFVGTAILARILDPHDFGLIGMAVLVTGLVQLFGNFGLGSAIVQKKDVTHDDLCTAFWANLLLGTLLMIICIIFSPIAAGFFREEAIKGILIYLAFTFFISALSSVHSSLAYKRIQMKLISVIELGGRIIRVGVMLASAYYGMSFWSIVIGIIAEKLFKTVGFFFLVDWRPTLLFCGKSFSEMFRFGRNILAGGFVGYVNQNVDFIVTGRILGAGHLGFYQMAFNLPYLLKGYIYDSIGNVAFPVFCKIQDDNERLARGFSKIVKFIAIVTFPILVGLAFTAHDFILFVYGEKWLPVVAPMQILCFSSALAALHAPVGSLLYAKGRPDIDLKWSLARFPFFIIAILFGARWNGIVGVAWGILFVEVLGMLMFLQVYLVLKVEIRGWLHSLFPAIFAAMTMLSVLWGLRIVFPLTEALVFIRLSLALLIGSCVYVSVIFLCFRETFREFIEFVRKMIFCNANRHEI